MTSNKQGSIVLSKTSCESDLKRYFTAVLKLSQSDNQFPINLDEVWPLVYSLRNKATRALRTNFFEGEDFITVTQNGQGGQFDKTDYYLSLSCMEYFIARRVRPVFEVYRKVFHKVAEPVKQLPQSYSEALRQLASQVEANEQLQQENKRLESKNTDLHTAVQMQKSHIEKQEDTIEQQTRELKAQAPKVNYYDEVLQSQNTMTTTQIAKGLGMEANTLNRKLRDAGIIFRQSGMWMLHAPYSRWNLHSVRTQTFTRSDGTMGTSEYTVWKNRGKRFIHALYDNDFNVRKALNALNGKEVAS